MSGKQHPRPRSRHTTSQEPGLVIPYSADLAAWAADIAQLVRLTARSAGCVCDPDVTLGMTRILVEHDSWCPLASINSH